jgi:hypothetical protein
LVKNKKISILAKYFMSACHRFLVLNGYINAITME